MGEDAALIVAAVVGGVVTAGATAAATWFITVRVERARRQGRTFDALAVVLAELESNRRELERYERDEIDLAGLRDGRLTLGDWTSNKGAAAGLATTAESLWADLAALYDDFHGTVRLGAKPPSAERVQKLEARLKEQLRSA